MLESRLYVQGEWAYYGYEVMWPHLHPKNRFIQLHYNIAIETHMERWLAQAINHAASSLGGSNHPEGGVDRRCMYSDLWVYETVCGDCTDTCLEGWDHTQFDLSCCPHMGVVSNTWPGVLTTRYSVYYIDSKRLWFCLRWLHPSLL